MRYMLSILLLLTFKANSQSSFDPFADPRLFEVFKAEDNPEGLYIPDSVLRIVADTLPLYTTEESKLWRFLRFVNYYCDSLNVLKRVYFSNGQEGRYYFYFQGDDLVKARFVSLSSGGTIFHFGKQDNELSTSEIQQRIQLDKKTRKSYEVLRLGRDFLKESKRFVFSGKGA